MSPQYTAEIFHPSSSVHNTHRATQKLDLPFRKSGIGQKTLSYIGPKTWNNLPAQIKLSKNVDTFRHDIKKSFFDDLQKPRECTWKKIDRGLGLFFGSEIFDILIFLGLENLSYFFGSEDFSLIFWGNNFDTIYFLGCPIK